MEANLRKLIRRILPHGPFDAIRQFALFAAAYYGYRLVRGAVDGRTATAFDNTRELISFERSLNAFIEPSVQAWVSGKQWLIDFASWMYVNSHFSITVSALIFMYVFHNKSFYFVRNMFMFAMGIALIGYAIYPAAPPRFMPEWGFQDSVAQYTGIPADSVTVNALLNPFAAVPSMHVGFALMIGISLATLTQRRWAKAIWLFYPMLVTFTVVATGNHFWMDAVLGALTAGLSALLSYRLAKSRPHSWSFRPASNQISS